MIICALHGAPPRPTARIPRKVRRGEDVVVPRARLLVRPHLQRERVDRDPFHRPRGAADALVPVPVDVGDSSRRQRHAG